MSKNTELLLLNTIENLGIVGDVVKVKTGYARNFLLPQGLAEKPTPTKIESLKAARAAAQAEMNALRSARLQIVDQLTDVTITLTRSCNDQGSLYGSVTPRDIADALHEAGHGVTPEYVRLAHPIRHIGSHPVPIQFDKDLKAEVTLVVNPDRELEDLMEEDKPAEAEEDHADDKNEAETKQEEETATAS